MKTHKGVIAFLAILNIVNLLGGVIVQLTLLFGWDFVSVIPITDMGTQEILYFNFMSVYIVISLISVIVSLLVSPTSFDIVELFTSSGIVSIILPAILFLLSIYTGIGATSTSERVICLLISAGFILSNAICFGAIEIIKSDDEDV